MAVGRGQDGGWAGLPVGAAGGRGGAWLNSARLEAESRGSVVGGVRRADSRVWRGSPGRSPKGSFVGGAGGSRRRDRGSGAAKMAASGWARAAVVLLCSSELLLLVLLPPRVRATEGPAATPGEAAPPPPKKKKDIRDYNDADMARLLEQWEVRSARTPALSALSRVPLSLTSHPLCLGAFRPPTSSLRLP